MYISLLIVVYVLTSYTSSWYVYFSLDEEEELYQDWQQEYEEWRDVSMKEWEAEFEKYKDEGGCA